MTLLTTPCPTQAKCPECDSYFDFKKGKKYCSDKCRKRVAGRKYDMKRLPVQSEKSVRFRNEHPTYDRDRMRNCREKYGKNDGIYAKLIEESFMPLKFESDACIVAGDWHIPAHHMGYVNWLLDVRQEYGIKDLCVPGDFFDADAYSLWPKIGHRSLFEKELEDVGMILDILTEKFDNVYFCRGNHEQRTINQNNGNIGMKELFAMTKVVDGYTVTMDDHMIMNDSWFICHPRSFRKTNLSVAKDLAAVKQMNIFCAHGHQWAQGFDASGKYQLLDGGGMFDRRCLAYLRTTTTHATSHPGFYIITPEEVMPFTLE